MKEEGFSSVFGLAETGWYLLYLLPEAIGKGKLEKGISNIYTSRYGMGNIHVFLMSPDNL